MKSDRKPIFGSAIDILITSSAENARKLLNMFVYTEVQCKYISRFVHFTRT